MRRVDLQIPSCLTASVVLRVTLSSMNTSQLIAQLRQERDKLDAAISALEGLDGTPARKPTGKAGAGTKGQAKPAKRKISAAARRKMSEAAKLRWAARKKSADKAGKAKA